MWQEIPSCFRRTNLRKKRGDDSRKGRFPEVFHPLVWPMQRHETCLGRPHGGTLCTTFGAFVCVCVFVGMLGWSVSLECLLFGSEMPFDCFCCEPRFVFLDHFIVFCFFQGLLSLCAFDSSRFIYHTFHGYAFRSTKMTTAFWWPKWIVLAPARPNVRSLMSRRIRR